MNETPEQTLGKDGHPPTREDLAVDPKKGKRSCLRCAFIGAAVGVAGLLIVYLIVVSQFNAIAGAMMEQVGTEVTGTAVAVDEVDISLAGGRGAVSGLRVASPEGYDHGTLFSVGGASAEIDIDSLKSKVPVIKSIEAHDAELAAEVRDGTSNIADILKNAGEFAKAHAGVGKKDAAPVEALPVDLRAWRVDGTRMTLARTGVPGETVTLSVESSSGSLSEVTKLAKNIVVQSPDEFDNREALRIDEMSSVFDPLSLLNPPMTVRKVEIRGIRANAESGPPGNNVGIVLTLIEDLLSSLGGEKSEGPGVAIDACAISDIDVKLHVTGKGSEGERLKVNVATVSGEPSNGTLQVENVFVGNPPGYKSEKAFTLDTVQVKFDFASLFSDTIVIDEVIVTGVHGIYETSIAGSNFTAVQREIDAFESSMGKSESSKKFVIRNLYIREIEGQLSPSLLRNVGVQPKQKIADMHLKDMDGASAAAILSQVVQQVIPGMNNMGEGLLQGLKGIGEGAGKVIEGTAKGAGKVIEGAGGMLKGLFGGRKKAEEEEPAPEEGTDTTQE